MTKLWIVDDDPAYTHLAKFLIADADDETDITTFSDGDLAIDHLTAHLTDAEALPDLILLDINMPRMDGWQFLDEYAALQDRLPRRITIYMLSSSIADGDKKRAAEYPFVKGYLVKPLEGEQFIRIRDEL
ncbi:MAG: response regulator [Bacteroidetes bacterium]|nr:response regulator [Bacteroidota bacterium]MBS1686324.1 response regulator [Bacteroidota bacterium]